MGEAARVVWASRSDCGNLGVLVLQGCRWHIRGFRALGMNRGGTSAECVAWFTEYGFEALLRVSICSLPVNGVFADAVCSESDLFCCPASYQDMAWLQRTQTERRIRRLYEACSHAKHAGN